MKQLGTVISLEGSPSTSEFSFVIDEQKIVRKGQYVQTDSEDGYIFGFVNEIRRGNRYFERAESVAEYERNSSMHENFPVNSWEYLIADVKVLGTFNGKKFSRTMMPPAPGAKIIPADEEMLRNFLGLAQNGILLGKLQHHDVEVKLDLTRLLQKHLAILAMSGAGKSHLASVLIEELLNRKKEDGRIAVVVVDIHGEYIGFKYDKNFSQKTKVIEGKNISIPLRKVQPELLEEWMPTLSHAQREVLRHVLNELRSVSKKERKGYSFSELLEAIDVSPMLNKKDNIRGPLKRSLYELRRYRFLSTNKENPKYLDDIKPGNLLILDFSDIDSLRKKQILVSLIARKLFNLRKKGKIAPFLLVLEEAHNFAREKAEAHEAISRSVIETIAREGRKFGASLCLISQRPVNLSTTALSQCNTHIILRVTNPNDLEHIQMSSEGIDARISRSITGLKTGEAIIVGEAVNAPIFVEVRDRVSMKKEKGEPLQRQAIEFERIAEKKAEDVEAFL